MSYSGHHSGGNTGRGNHGGGRDRDRDTIRSDRPERSDRQERSDKNDRSDRNYGSHSSQVLRRYGPQSSESNDLSSSSSYRRQEGSRDFHGYRSGNNRLDGNGRPQSSSGNGGSSSTKHRDGRPHQSFHLGSKYRPGVGRPKGPLLAHHSDPPRLRIPPNNAGESLTKNLLEERRPLYRKQDWDSSMPFRPKHQLPRVPLGPRDHREPHRSENKDVFRSKTEVKTDYDAAPTAGRNSEGLGPRNQRSENKVPLRPKGMPQISQLDPQVSVRSSEMTGQPKSESVPVGLTHDEPLTPKPDDKREPIRAPAVSTQHNSGVHETLSDRLQSVNESESRRDRLQRMFDDDSSSNVGPDQRASTESSLKARPEAKDEDDHVDEASGSPSSNGFDTSVLSPVGSTASDDAFARTLNIIPEGRPESFVKHADEAEIHSEAETVIEDGSVDLAKARLFVRKKGRDAFRERAKRRNVVYSEDDEDHSDTHAGESAPDLHTMAKQHESYLSGDLDHDLNIPSSPRKREQTLADAQPKNISFADNEVVHASSHNVPFQRSLSRSTYKVKRDSTGRSQLQRACKKGDLEEVRSLIQKGASANECDFGGFTCLHEAALAGHTEIVKLLIASGADVNKQAFEAGDFETPLMDAAENKHVSTVETLLMHGADPHLCNNEGYSTITKLFHLQEDDDDYEEVIKVINDFAPPQINSELSKVTHSPRQIIEDPSEKYFSELARKKSHSLIYKYAAQGNKESAAEDFVTHGLSLLKMPDVLNLAARNGHVELVDILLGLNPGSFDINQLNKIGVNALLATVGRGYHDVVKFLLSKGANPYIKRAKDGLTALEIAKHSSQYDPREVVILEESMNGEENTKQIIAEKLLVPRPSPTMDLSSKDAPILEFMNDTKSESYAPGIAQVGRVSDGVDERNKKSPEDLPTLRNNFSVVNDEKIKARRSTGLDSSQSSVTNDVKHITPKEPGKRKMSIGEWKQHKKSKKEHDSTILDEALLNLQEPPESDTRNEVESQGDVFSQPSMRSSLPAENDNLPPIPSVVSPTTSKAQEEQKSRAAEQAKIWQEKVQAKKKARKEMFLLAEKEKERRKKEDEERRIELMKKQEVERRQEELRAEVEARKLAEETERKKNVMEYQCILQKYPAGLRDVVFDGSFKRDERLKYTPLYVFEFDNDRWVVDIQLSLILGISASQMHSLTDDYFGPYVDEPSKDKLWSLFFHMIGVGKDNTIENDGMEKFRCLQLRFVHLSRISDWIKQEHFEAYQFLWTEGRLAAVDLNSIDTAQPMQAKRDLNGMLHRPEVGFVPPRLQHRVDVLRTMQSAESPLW